MVAVCYDRDLFSCRFCETAPHLKELNGCTGPTRGGKHFIAPGVEVERCPVTYVGPQEVLLLDLCARADKGISPLEGGMLTWPAPLAEALRVLDFESNKKRDRDWKAKHGS